MDEGVRSLEERISLLEAANQALEDRVRVLEGDVHAVWGCAAALARSLQYAIWDVMRSPFVNRVQHRVDVLWRNVDYAGERREAANQPLERRLRVLEEDVHAVWGCAAALARGLDRAHRRVMQSPLVLLVLDRVYFPQAHEAYADEREAMALREV